MERVFSVATRIATVYSVGSPEGTHMLTVNSLLAWFDVWANITTFTFEYDKINQSLDSLCIAASDGSCQFATIFAFWDYNRTLIASQSLVELNRTIVDAGHKVRRLLVNIFRWCFLLALVLSRFFAIPFLKYCYYA